VLAQYPMRGVMVDVVMEDDEGTDGKEFCFSVRAQARAALSVRECTWTVVSVVCVCRGGGGGGRFFFFFFFFCFFFLR
jgi:hypothetical protein